MTFSQFLLELRRRSAALPDDGRCPDAIERIAREILDDMPESEQGTQVRRILAAFLGLGKRDEFDVALLDQLTPELILRLDMIAAEFLDDWRTHDAVRALRGALVRSLQ